MDAVLEDAKQMELKYKNKIIELEKELEFENLRANEYENKFKEAVMSSSSSKEDQNLLKRLTETEQQLTRTRRQLYETNRKLSSSNDNESLISQNEELSNIIEELKNAAIAAIMEKQSEIEELKKNIVEIQNFDQIQILSEKNIELENRIDQVMEEHQEELKTLNEKLMDERESFAQNLTVLQQQSHHEESQKFELMEKAQNLEGSLENMERVISLYEAKIYDLEQQKASFKVTIAQNQHKNKMEIESILADLKVQGKAMEEKEKDLTAMKKTIDYQKKQIKKLGEEKEESQRKLKIKNKKQSTRNQNIYESFEGFSQKANLFTSFARPNMYKQQVKESFMASPIKLSEISSEIQVNDIDTIENFSDEIDQQLSEVSQSQEQSETTNNTPAINQNIKNSEIDTLTKQIGHLNKEIDRLTAELQEERKSKLELKQKFSKEDSCSKIERQSQRLHIYKLENALLIEKLQNAEKLESNREIREYEKKVYEQEIKKLKAEIESPKKKKGFFK